MESPGSPIVEKQRKAVFAGCARNAAAHLPKVLDNISRMADLFADAAFIFMENDSADDTKAILHEWCAKRPSATVVSFDGLVQSQPLRTLRLAGLRNRYVDLARQKYGDFDFLIMLDCDDLNGRPIDLDAVRRAIAFLEEHEDCAGVTANSNSEYYDMWALRHETLCPNDIWEEVCDYAIAHHVSDDAAFAHAFKKRIFKLDQNESPIEVLSAFNGLAIYRMASVRQNKAAYVGQKLKVISRPDGAPLTVGWQCCEHVPFNLGFRAIGQKLFILPYLVTNDFPTVYFVPGFWRSLLSDITRNQPCPCGSGQRFKHCHGKL